MMLIIRGGKSFCTLCQHSSRPIKFSPLRASLFFGENFIIFIIIMSSMINTKLSSMIDTKLSSMINIKLSSMIKTKLSSMINTKSSSMMTKKHRSNLTLGELELHYQGASPFQSVKWWWWWWWRWWLWLWLWWPSNDYDDTMIQIASWLLKNTKIHDYNDNVSTGYFYYSLS